MTLGRLNGVVKTLDAQSILSKNSRLLSKFTARKLNSSGGSNAGVGSSQQTPIAQISSLAGLEWPGMYVHVSIYIMMVT